MARLYRTKYWVGFLLVLLVALACSNPSEPPSRPDNVASIESEGSGSSDPTGEVHQDNTEAGVSTGADTELGAEDTGPQLVDEDSRRSQLPDLLAQTALPFDGCFKEAEDNPFAQEDLSNPVLDEIREKILSAEQSNTKQKFPIVLVPGYLGTDSMDLKFTQMDYWYGVVDALAEQGYTQVYPANIDAVGYSSDGPIGDSADKYEWIQPINPGYRGRSTQLKDIVEEVLAQTGASKVNLIAHSQGALTARWMICNLQMAERVENLVTLSGALRGVPLTEIALGDNSLPAWMMGPIESIMTAFLGGITSSSEDAHAHGSHVEMWPEYTNKIFNPACPDMPGVRYFSFAAKLEDVGETSFSPYLFSPFWAVHTLYAMSKFDVGPNDGLVPVESAREPFDNSDWIYVGEIVGKKVLPGTGIESKFLGFYWGIDHGAFMNFPFGTTGLFHFDGLSFFVDLARMLDAHST